jgi:phytanoyl-CoA hydroxylase
MFTQEYKQFYDTNGYVVVPQVFTPEEVVFYRDHYMRMRAAGSHPGDDAGIDIGSNDPLKRFPRMLQMHRWDDISLQWMIDPRINTCLTGLLEREPYAVQTMLYFKPAGARGQALHQDNYYLRVQPGTCMAAWMALDDCDEANGCMQVVAGSHIWPMLCTVEADITKSFSGVTVPIPEDSDVRPVVMRAGDVLFFNGSLVHGSYPNTSQDRFRRTLIGHYIEGDAQKVGQWYHPVLQMNGQQLDFGVSPGGLPCGVWTEQDAVPTIEVSGYELVDASTRE